MQLRNLGLYNRMSQGIIYHIPVGCVLQQSAITMSTVSGRLKCNLFCNPMTPSGADHPEVEINK